MSLRPNLAVVFRRAEVILDAQDAAAWQFDTPIARVGR